MNWTGVVTIATLGGSTIAFGCADEAAYIEDPAGLEITSAAAWVEEGRVHATAVVRNPMPETVEFVVLHYCPILIDLLVDGEVVVAGGEGACPRAGWRITLRSGEEIELAADRPTRASAEVVVPPGRYELRVVLSLPEGQLTRNAGEVEVGEDDGEAYPPPPRSHAP